MNSRHKILLKMIPWTCVILVLSAVDIWSVTVTPAGPGRGHWRNYDITDGVAAGGMVRSIHQDRDGYLWFGTRGGVNRYDGQTWVTLTDKDGLAHNDVRDVYQDRDGRVDGAFAV